MGYQALLFCPDEKTARTVTQVLTELDFSVAPCVEPFAAVKKLMAERFDAVVVDCDNEQNATLLFKSARNSPGNQSSLAVAVVEGQAGVAKAFRIGANLVLTKPINVDQAKGTLRVARGLLRRGEISKSVAPPKAAESAASSPAPKPAAQPVPQPSAMPFAPGVMHPVAEPAQSIVASSVVEPAATADSSVAQTNTVWNAAPIAPAATVDCAPAASPSSGSAAAAPAPARETSAAPVKPEAPTVSEPEVQDEVAPASDVPSTKDAAEPALLFSAANAGAGSKSGSRKAIFAIAAIVLIAAAGYEAWTQWGSSYLNASAPVHIAAPVAKPPVVAPVLPSPAVTSAGPQPKDTTPAPETTVTDEKAHQQKIAATVNSSKPANSSPSAVDKAPVTKSAQPLVIKNGVSDKHTVATEAPALSMSGIATAGELPNLASGSKAPAPVLQTTSVSQGVSRGLLVKQVQPTYPSYAVQMRVEGTVQLLATISKTGDITAVKILSGDPQLVKAAADAVKQWKYKPYLLNGEPIEIQTQITVNFKLPR
jgi:periplasmic protein TonB